MEAAGKSKILLIIPAYNEAEGIEALVKKVDAFRASSKYSLDYVVINDGSKDNTEEVLTKSQIIHVELLQNLGIGGAVQTGYRYALENNYDIAVQFDGDGQHNIEDLSVLIDPIIAGEQDFTVGSRFVDDSESEFKSSTLRQVGIRVLSFILKLVSGVEILDITSGYRAGNRQVIEEFANNYPVKYPEPETYITLARKNLRIKELGVKMFEREFGKSSISVLKGGAYMFSVSMTLIFVGLFERRK
ncbi:MAG: glycosyltransferase family 2 protein [Streptococcaceae bacterium]|jgi:glycosyltransferase involved in cell wall biosynthesis|nr:glycosyltransferase family 2 protein [Streptococcaceae bacterium]